MLFHYKKWFFSPYKNHVKSSVITKRSCFLKTLSDVVFLNENKGFKYCFFLKPFYAANVLRRLWILLGWWGQRSSPSQTVQGLWHLTTCFSQLYSLYSEEKKKLVMSKKHDKTFFIDTKGKLWSSPMLKNKTDRCWNPCQTNARLTGGCLEHEALKK